MIKKVLIFLFMMFPSVVLADYKLMFSTNIELPKQDTNYFITPRHDYSDENFTIFDKTSFELGSLFDNGVYEPSDIPDGGVFWKNKITGDFEASFETDSWGKLNSGFLGLFIKRGDQLTRLIEVASYSVWKDGCPFPRRFNPYEYTSVNCNLSSRYKFSIKKSNGKIVSTIKNLNKGDTYSKTINANDSAVQIGIYFVYGDEYGSFYDKKKIINFNVSKL